MKEFKRYLITAALPYANGPVHIGHLAGVYVPADIYVRYLRMQQRDAVFVCGSDEHGVPITIKAQKEGVTPQQIVDRYHGIIKQSFSDFGIQFDNYSRTSMPLHHEVSSKFFEMLYEKGEFIEKTSEQYYDPVANQFLADRYITGTCPKCGSEGAYGDQCEKCGSSLSPTELINPKSALSGEAPVMRETRHWYLPLDKHETFLRQWILEENKSWKSNVYGQCKSWIDQGLQPRAVSRDLDWGVPVPVADAKGKVLYVWFDAPIGYISATREILPDTWEKYWKSEDSKLVHFIGKDNIVFHCIVFPSMLKAHGGYILPDNVPANEFLNLEGNKISTSRNWAVWLHEYLLDFPGLQDSLRYVLTANAPETKDNDFTWKDFQTRNNSELVAILGNFVNRVVTLTDKYYEGHVPAITALTEVDNEALAQIGAAKKAVEENLENYRFREALREAMNLARVGNKYLTDTEPWKMIKTDAARVQTIMNVCLQITANLGLLFEPFLPFSAAKIRSFINLPASKWAEAGNPTILQVGHKTGKSELLFRKIEDAEIEAQINKLEASKQQQAVVVEAAKAAPQKDFIEFDDFQKMDIRVGTILEAEKVAGAKKLLKFLVDTGIDKRTIVSGIAEYYAPEQLIGKRVSVLVNLKPRMLKGIESQGMLLLSENADGRLLFVSPHDEAENGGAIK